MLVRLRQCRERGPCRGMPEADDYLVRLKVWVTVGLETASFVDVMSHEVPFKNRRTRPGHNECPGPATSSQLGRDHRMP